MLTTSTVQAAIHRDDRRVPGAHQVSFLFEVEGPLLPEQVEHAFAALQARHPLLRSTFGEVDGRLLRRVHAALPVPVQFLAADRAGAAARIQASLLDAIPVETAPPLRAALFAVGGRTHWLHLLLHHHAYDAMTMPALVGELLALLGGDPLAEAAADHRAFVEAEAAWLASPRAESARRSVAARVRGRPLRLPVAPGPAATVQRAARARWVAPDARPGDVLARLLAGWWLTLADWLGRDDLAIGTTASLRRGAWADVVGPAFQYLPLVPPIPRGLPLERAEAAARTELRQAWFAAWLPLAEARAASGQTGDDTHLGLNANLNFYDADAWLPEPLKRLRTPAGTAVGALRVRELPVPEADVPRPYDLNLGLVRLGGGLAAQLRYRPDLLTPAEADGLLGALGRRLELAS